MALRSTQTDSSSGWIAPTFSYDRTLSPVTSISPFYTHTHTHTDSIISRGNGRKPVCETHTYTPSHKTTRRTCPTGALWTSVRRRSPVAWAVIICSPGHCKSLPSRSGANMLGALSPITPATQSPLFMCAWGPHHKLQALNPSGPCLPFRHRLVWLTLPQPLWLLGYFWNPPPPLLFQHLCACCPTSRNSFAAYIPMARSLASSKLFSPLLRSLPWSLQLK